MGSKAPTPHFTPLLYELCAGTHVMDTAVLKQTIAPSGATSSIGIAEICTGSTDDEESIARLSTMSAVRGRKGFDLPARAM